MEKLDWFKKKDKQFLKNIDTFYYSVYFTDDFTRYSKDKSVYRLRVILDSLRNEKDCQDITFGKDFHVIYQPGSFSNYGFRFTSPEFFDFFVAPVVNTDDTPVAIMQLRSRSLWEDGVYSSFDDSFEFIQAFSQQFGLTIREVRENRCDFACHSNYLSDPESFFDRDHFVKMWVGSAGRTKEKTKHMLQHITIYDDDTTETDYIAIGKRGSKCFIRIYLKSKEVVQEGYKGFFLQLWYLSGMISKYDLYCLEEAYKRKSWAYVDFARLDWALKNDDHLSDVTKNFIKSLLEDDKPDINIIHKAAKQYTQPVTKVFNVEFQCMRDMSKSFQLIKKNEGVTGRVYDYLDNYSLIYEYLTRVTLRLVRVDQVDQNKSRRDNCAFWERLRNAKTIDFKKKHKDSHLIRKYTSNVNLELRKKRAINALSGFGFALNHDENGSIMDDATNFISILNDNDLDYIDKHKKKLAARNAEIIPDDQKRFRSAIFLYDPENNQFY